MDDDLGYKLADSDPYEFIEPDYGSEVEQPHEVALFLSILNQTLDMLLKNKNEVAISWRQEINGAHAKISELVAHAESPF